MRPQASRYVRFITGRLDPRPTWVYEASVVALVLSATAVMAGNRWQDWLGALAVQLTFHHAAIAERLAERQRFAGQLAVAFVNDQIGHPRFVGAFAALAVPCHRWLGRTFVAKEACWLGYFLATRSWPALTGVVVFLAYPVWRRHWRRSHPLSSEEPVRSVTAAARYSAAAAVYRALVGDDRG